MRIRVPNNGLNIVLKDTGDCGNDRWSEQVVLFFSVILQKMSMNNIQQERLATGQIGVNVT